MIFKSRRRIKVTVTGRHARAYRFRVGINIIDRVIIKNGNARSEIPARVTRGKGTTLHIRTDLARRDRGSFVEFVSVKIFASFVESKRTPAGRDRASNDPQRYNSRHRIP